MAAVSGLVTPGIALAQSTDDHTEDSAKQHGTEPFAPRPADVTVVYRSSPNGPAYTAQSDTASDVPADNAGDGSAAPASDEPSDHTHDPAEDGASEQTSETGQTSINHGSSGDELLDLSFEELLSQEVTSAAKKSRRVADSAAAVTVITQDDIRRSSARTVPDLLRMVPGMEIAEVQSSATSVSSRGFTSRFAANMLVMIDGAAIYSTSISGMFWDQALLPLQDIERIEVIRGPGGTLWGSNAMNGIVNIITKQSIDTQGLRLNASLGTFDMRAELGFGKQVNESLGFRVYGNYRRTNGLDAVGGPIMDNSWRGALAGIRVDYAPTSDSSLVLMGEYSDGNFSEHVIDVVPGFPQPQTIVTVQDNDFGSAHVLARWKHSISEQFDYTIQGYFNELKRTEFEATIDRKLYDLSFEARVLADERHEINLGIAGRVVNDRVTNSPALMLPGGRNTDRKLTGYIQDDISLIPDKLRVTIGSKFEHNNYTGTEIQPSARIFYRTSPHFALWGAASRAVRTPLLLQREMIASVTSLQDVPGFGQPIPVRGIFIGSEDSVSERVNTYELGFRGDFGENWSFDATTYYARYRKLATAQITEQNPLLMPGVPFPIGLEVVNVVGNDGYGRGYGGEIMVTGRIAPWWQIETSYSYLNLKESQPLGAASLASDGNSPYHQLRLRSDMDFNDRVSLSGFLHHVSVSRDRNRAPYTDLDLKLTYRLNARIEFSAAGRNLLNKRHIEYLNSELPIFDVYVPRSAYVEARMRF